MSYGTRAALGDVPSLAGSPPVRTRYPSGPNAGQLADRYATYNDVPYLLRPFAEQLGTAGFWYAPPANPLDTLEDQGSTAYDAATGAVASGINYASDAVLGLGKNTLYLAAAAGLAWLVLPGLLRGKR